MAVRIALIVALVLGAVGCAGSNKRSASFDFQARSISLETVPAGAAVYQVNAFDGSRTWLGTTPLRSQTVSVMTTLKKAKGDPAFLQHMTSQIGMVCVAIEKPGYQTYMGNLSTEPAGKVASHQIELQKQ